MHTLTVQGQQVYVFGVPGIVHSKYMISLPCTAKVHKDITIEFLKPPLWIV